MLLQLYAANIEKLCCNEAQALFICQVPKVTIKIQAVATNLFMDSFGENHFQIQCFCYLDMKTLHCAVKGQRDSFCLQNKKCSL